MGEAKLTRMLHAKVIKTTATRFPLTMQSTVYHSHREYVGGNIIALLNWRLRPVHIFFPKNSQLDQMLQGIHKAGHGGDGSSV